MNKLDNEIIVRCLRQRKLVDYFIISTTPEDIEEIHTYMHVLIGGIIGAWGDADDSEFFLDTHAIKNFFIKEEIVTFFDIEELLHKTEISIFGVTKSEINYFKELIESYKTTNAKREGIVHWKIIRNKK